jgi:hypothetical protein
MLSNRDVHSYTYLQEEQQGGERTYRVMINRDVIARNLSVVELVEFAIRKETQRLLSIMKPRNTYSENQSVFPETIILSIAKCLLSGREACLLRASPPHEDRVQAWVALEEAAERFLGDFRSCTVKQQITADLLDSGRGLWRVALIVGFGGMNIDSTAMRALKRYQKGKVEETYFSPAVRSAVTELHQGAVIEGQHSPDRGVSMWKEVGDSVEVSIPVPEFVMEYPERVWQHWPASRAFLRARPGPETESGVGWRFGAPCSTLQSGEGKAHPFIYPEGDVCIGDTKINGQVGEGWTLSPGALWVERVHLLREVIMFGAHRGNHLSPVFSGPDVVLQAEKAPEDPRIPRERREELRKRGVQIIAFGRNM